MSTAQPRQEELDLAAANVRRLIARQAIPMAGALFLIALSWIVDSYLIGRLGEQALAASGFAAPIVAICVSGASGFSRGITMLVSQCLGRGDRAEAARLSTAVLLLVAVAGCAIVPLFAAAQPWLFAALGAPAELVPAISQYMLPLLVASCLITAAFSATAALRGTGDAQVSAIVLAVGSALHMALDPLFILGVGPFPGFGLTGAGIASSIAYSIATVLALLYLRKKELLTSAFDSTAVMFVRWVQILRISFVTTLANLLFPLAGTVLTAVVALHGAESVAGYAVGTRFHRMVGIVMISLGAAVVPMVAFNLASGNLSRVRETIRHSSIYGLAWGATNWFLLWLFAAPLAQVFCNTAPARAALIGYLQIASGAATAQCVLSIITSAFAALGKLGQSTLLSFVSSLGLVVPCAWLGERLMGVAGIFAGLTLATAISGVLGWIWLSATLSALARERDAPAALSTPRAA